MRRKSNSKPKRPLSAKAQARAVVQKRIKRALAARKGWTPKRKADVKVKNAFKKLAKDINNEAARKGLLRALKFEDMVKRGYTKGSSDEDIIQERMNQAREEGRWNEERDQVCEDYDLDYGEFWDIVDYEDAAG